MHKPIQQALRPGACQQRPSCALLSGKYQQRCRNGRVVSIAQPTWLLQPCIASTSSSDNPEVSMEELFAAELANRQAADAKQAEVAAAAVFDGPALLALLRKKYGRSYDVSLVQRTYLGKVFVALNVMWKYMEQQSFSYSEEQYMQRLEYVAAALVSWGAVTTVQSQLAATKERPRVGKAVSIMLDVPEEKAREWIAL